MRESGQKIRCRTIAYMIFTYRHTNRVENIEKGISTMDQPMCYSVGGQDSSVGKSLDLQSTDCGRIRASLPAGCLFWYDPLTRPSLQIASVGLDHHTKKMEVPTHGLGSKSLRGCKRSTFPFLLRAAEFRRVKCKQMA